MKKEIRRYAWYMDDIYQGLSHLDKQHSNHVIVESMDINDDEGYYLVFTQGFEIRYRHFSILENRYLKNFGINLYRELPSFINCTLNRASTQPKLYEEGLQEFGLGAIELSA